ncbi:MAG: AIR synthase-related protein, partial [Planctomycetota bacterium]
ITRRFEPNKVIRGAAHITGGGIAGNLERIIPEGLCATINTKCWEPPSIFRYIQNRGKISTPEMYRVFNMGIGFIIVVNRDYLSSVQNYLEKNIKEKYYLIGVIEEGINKVKMIY